MIEILSLTKRFGEHTAVDNLSFKASAGDVVGLVGPNGAGKSTAMKILAGCLVPNVGCVRVCGFDVHAQTLSARRIMGYLPQGTHCYVDMSVLGFLQFIARVRGLHGAQQRSRIDHVVAQLHLEPILRRTVATLPKDLNRLVGLAQAVLHEPQVLILDEPTNGLDPNQQYQVRTLINNVSRDKVIILATHALEEVSALCSRALIVANGQLLADSTPSELQRRSRYRDAVTLLAEHPLDLFALAVLPGVAGIEKDQRTPGAITVLARPDSVIHPGVSKLIVTRGWRIKALDVECGRLDDVFRQLTQATPL